MNESSNKTVLITPKKTEKTTLSAAQKRFNSLTKKIDVERNRLIEWQETTHTYHQKLNNEYEPLLNELIDAKKRYKGKKKPTKYEIEDVRKNTTYLINHLIEYLYVRRIRREF